MASTNTKAAAEVQEKKFDWHQIKSYLPIISFVAIVAIFAILTGGALITPRNITLIISGGFTLMIATVGVYMIMSMGCLDFSQGSMMGLSCAVVCFLSQYNPILAIVGGMATGALIGLINALFHVKGQVQSFVVTMCMMFLLRGVIAYITTSSPVYAATYLTALATNTPLLIGIVVAVLVIAYLVLHFTALGSNLKAIGASESGARFAGINVQRTKIIIYVVAGAITGFAALINAIRIGSVTSQAGNMLETQILIALVLGGMPINGGARSRFSSVVTGVLSYLVLQRGLVMLGFTTEIQQLILGIVFVIMVAVFSERAANQVIK
ncbi:ABC transporter permease [Collinsella ihumii]|uniref:ABC transporter permease n=1 Tax=Collinsella ihumii TaxID=1720204 RepID=A0ABT7XDW0_9ACTN|nr:ABC transporter permease [Collinsella ihumii]MBM6687618.1 ABC transporter permease [Collinsella tanakaei]MBM6777779.1 ABC transporter permease [Collinsella tanakaei]MDN0063596.1 ABC transporter permease [Collinsella ihumii]